MSTQDQLNANRTNAQSSTGPKTDEGKATSSQNAVKHGFFAKNDVISGEDLARYEQHRQDIYDEFVPFTPTESVLTQRIASLTWRLMRADRLQTTVINTLVNVQHKANHPPPLPQINIAGMVKSFRLKDADPDYPITDAELIMAGLAHFKYEPITLDPAVDEAMHAASNPPGSTHLCDAEIELGTVIYNDFHGSAVIERLQGYEQKIESSLFKTIRQFQQFQSTRIKQDYDRDRRDMQYLRAEDQAKRDREEAEYRQNIRDKANPAPDDPEPEPLNVLQEYELRKIGRLPKPRNEPNIPITSITETTYNRNHQEKANRKDSAPQPPDGPATHPGRSANK